MRYKVGDTPRVREDIDPYKQYAHDDDSECDIFVPEMISYAGQRVLIREIACGKYLIAGMDDFYWTDGMFENDDIDYELPVKADIMSVLMGE